MPRKVFELANELGVGAIELVEKLKSHGMNLRNHMVTLTDEEAEKVLQIMNPANAKDNKPTVKKVVKKVVKKAETTAAPEVAAPVANTTESEVPPSGASSSTLVKRKSKVIVRKSSEGESGIGDESVGQEQSYQVEDSINQTPELEHEVAFTSEVEAQGPVAGTNDDDFERRGFIPEKSRLEVVSRPAVVEKKVVPPVEEERATPKSSKEYLVERMHSFTPIYVPPKTAADTKKDSEKSSNQVNKEKTSRLASMVSTDAGGLNKSPIIRKGPIDSAPVEVVEDEDDKNKKRIGDMAAVVAKKGVAKVKDLNLMRAEEEYKSYALGVVGKVVYTPAKKKKVYLGPSQQTKITEMKESKRVIDVHGGCTAEELAYKLSVRFEQLMDKALDINLLLKKQDYLGITLLGEVCALYNFKVEDKTFKEETVIKKDTPKVEGDLPPRAPIVAIMGHVDHGKTSLLDYIRKAKVAAGEAGGITQHIGAYSVKMNDSTITFLDTPGHAAFASMRQRGAKATDIVVLVVAADDGVMPQTKESIRFCQEAGVPIIVAVNKMDKEGANPDRVKQELMEFQLTPEEWGGETQYVEVSALKGTGIEKLLESIALQAEIMELRANPKGPAEGVVIESKIETGRGPIATILVQSGTLEKGDYIVAGETIGRARSLMDYTGAMLKSAGPSTPIQILGLEEAPQPGDIVNVMKNEREARKVIENRINERKTLENSPQKKMSLEDFFKSAKESDEKKILKLIIRTDVQGSFEAIKNAVTKLGNNEVGVDVIGGGVGAISDNDVLLASSIKGFIIGFNMRPVTTARKLAEDKGVDIKTYSIIYELINEVKLALEGMLEPERFEKYLGRAEVRSVFVTPKAGTVAGCFVVDGKIQRGSNLRILREGKILYEGKIGSLRRFKDDVKEVAHNYECGIGVENFNDIKAQDIFEAYVMEEKKRVLESEVTF